MPDFPTSEPTEMTKRRNGQKRKSPYENESEYDEENDLYVEKEDTKKKAIPIFHPPQKFQPQIQNAGLKAILAQLKETSISKTEDFQSRCEDLKKKTHA